MHRSLTGLAVALLAAPGLAQEAAAPAAHLSQFGDGSGPTHVDGEYRLLDAAGTPKQSNAVGFDLAQAGAHETLILRFALRVLEGGDGGAIVFLNANEYGARGPAAFVPSWVEPNLRGTFAVGIDVHNPPDEEMFSAWGNYRDEPQREISLHFDGRELVKRVAPEEFRGDWAEGEIRIEHGVGGAEVTVRLGDGTVYDRYFVPGLLPYPARLAVGAGTRADVSTEFAVRDLKLEASDPAKPRRRPTTVEIFNHVLTDNSKTTFDAEVDLPPAEWAFGRVILTLDIHDAGPNWDEWDRNAELSVIDANGVKRGIVPFITSYRTPCHWEVDVTHFRPYLTGKTRFEIDAGTRFYKNRGYMLSASLAFHHGTPELEAYSVIPLWHGRANHGKTNGYRDFFTPQSVAIGAETRAARVFTMMTGHSQVGEFTPCSRTLVFAPKQGGDAAAEQRFESRLWKDDVYLNPNRPQSGTWKFSRAGWSPGDVVWPWIVDLTPHLATGATAEFRYEPGPYEFPEGEEPAAAKEIGKANQVVRSYLVQYRDPTATQPAPTVRITTVVADSNAAKNGVKQGDWLARYDGQRVDSVEELRVALKAAKDAGKERVTIVVFRGTERVELDLESGRMGVNLRER